MHDPLVKQYEEAFGIVGRRTRARKRFFRRMRHYKIYKGILGEKRAQKLMTEACSHGKL